LSAELILLEYLETYNLQGIINRCGVISGPWQMGKVDQGVMVLWMARHMFGNRNLTYIGYGGTGKQVRDFIHIDDLFEALMVQLENFNQYNGQIYNLGGGLENSLSLQEMTAFCAAISGNKIPIESVLDNRPNDIRIYISDCAKFKKISGWTCKKNAQETFSDIYQWLIKYQSLLRPILS